MGGGLRLACGLALVCAGAVAHDVHAQTFAPAQIKRGAEIYATHCTTCHGERMKNPPWASDLATFPRDERDRFVNSVTYGVRNMPPWSDVIKPDEIEALWAYLVAGERKN